MYLSLHERIKGAEGISIASLVFEHFIHEEQGGAISIEASKGITITIKDSLFHECLTEMMGGAIYASSSGTMFTLSNCCFDTCSITAKVDNRYGNALNIQSSKKGDAKVNQTIFYFSGPKLSISSDSTIYFLKTASFLTSPNFTDCCSYRGSCTVSIDQQYSKLLYMQSSRGISLHIASIIGYEKVEIERSNIINWTQQSDNPYPFFPGTTEVFYLKDCSIFVLKTYDEPGNCVFTNCYGNIDHKDITKQSLTEFEIDEVKFGAYCRAFVNVYLDNNIHCARHSWKQLITSCLSLF